MIAANSDALHDGLQTPTNSASPKTPTLPKETARKQR